MLGIMERIYTALFSRITSNQYGDSDWLREDSVAEEFGVSRTPVRSVLKQLEQDGLVELIPKKGARVLPFTLDDFEEIYDLRLALESLALRKAIPLIKIDGLVTLRQQMAALSDTDDTAQYRATHDGLHTYIVESTGCRRLIAFWSQVFRLNNSFWGAQDYLLPKVVDQTMQIHLDLIDALLERDVETASRLLAEDILFSKKWLMDRKVKGVV